MSSAAYLLVIINEHGQIERIAAYSERNPTMLFRHTSALIHETEGDNYGEALTKMRTWAKAHASRSWVLDALDGKRPGMSDHLVQEAAAGAAASVIAWFTKEFPDALKQGLLAPERLNMNPGVIHSKADMASHVLYMSREIFTFIIDGRREKAMRWLGFIQGYLWANNIQSITELKDTNKPKLEG